MKCIYLFLLLGFGLQSCSQTQSDSLKNQSLTEEGAKVVQDSAPSLVAVQQKFVLPDSLPYKSIHVFVALCDNENQGIVPVPASIGNGTDFNQNLYWGCGYGVRTYFKKSSEWKFLGTQNSQNPQILERILFKHKTKNVYLLADAYNGAHIKECTEQYLESLSGRKAVQVEHAGDSIQFGSASSLCAYIGHNGLMDFDLDQKYEAQDSSKRDAIILACKSYDYYLPYVKSANAYPLVLTNGFMAPEAYSLEWALKAWVNNKPAKEVEEQASQAYNHYQKCGIKGARWLMRSGW